MTTPTIGINDFVLRQTPKSKFSHYTGAWPQLINMVRERWDGFRTAGYRDGVVLILMEGRDFRCGVVELTPQSKITATFGARREDEEPYVQIEAHGSKIPAAVAEVVLYRRDVLGSDVSSECEWEIISINARPTLDPEPLTPMAMARNMLELPGGTAASYTAEQFAESIVYWSKRAMVAEREEGDLLFIRRLQGPRGDWIALDGGSADGLTTAEAIQELWEQGVTIVNLGGVDYEISDGDHF